MTDNNRLSGPFGQGNLNRRAALLAGALAVFLVAPPAFAAVASIPAPAGLAGWWRGEGDAKDSIAANHGVAGGGVTYGIGEVGQAFQFAPAHTGVRIPTSATLNVGSGSGLTIECWINPQSLLAAPLVEWNNGTQFGAHFWAVGQGNLYANIVDGSGGNHTLSSGAGVVKSNLTQHVATTYDKATGVLRLFCNGNVVAQTTVGSVAPQTSYDMFIGRRPAAPDVNSFIGTIDEVSIYNRALGTNEIAAIWAADGAGKYVTPPVQPLLLNVDFGAGTATPKTGYAVFGQSSNDVWNLYSRDGADPYDWRTFGTVTNLKYANGTLSGVNLSVSNAPGAWGNGSADPMFATYLYPFDGGNIVLTLDALPTGQYDFIFYGHGLPADQNGAFELVVDGSSYGTKATAAGTGWQGALWQEGLQYVAFRGVPVTRAGAPISVIVHPAASSYAIIAGLQIATASAVATPPLITQHPTNRTVIAGDPAAFVVAASSSSPLTYQWRFNGGPIGGATNSSLVLPETQPAQAGSYSVIVSNTAGAVTSSNATLAVVIPTCTPAPAGLVGWWAGNGNTINAGSPDMGTLTGNAGYAAGKVAQAFSFTALDQSVQIPDAPALNPTNGLTLEAWVMVAQYPGNDGVVVAGKDWMYAQRQYMIALNSVGGRWGFRPHVGVASGLAYFDGATAIQTNTWYHVAMTYDNATLRLYVNGKPDGSLTVGGPVIPTANPLLIGGFGQAPWTLLGRVDELSLYNRALGTNEIAAIYAARGAGKCPLPPQPLVLNVDFGTGTATPKTGYAVVGQSNNDVWNLYSRDGANPNDWRTFGTVTNLKYANGTLSGMNLSVSNAPGAWGNGSSDPMFDTYLYPFNGGNIVLRLEALPAGQYDFIFYGHGLPADQNGAFELVVDSSSYGTKATAAGTGWQAPLWQEGLHYVAFRGVPVTRAGAAISVIVHPAASSYAIIAGMQIATASAVATPPLITQHPTNRTVIAGDPTAFAVAASSSSPLTYQWQFNGGPIGGATNSSLVLPETQPAQAGNYSVIVSNTAGAVTSSNATLAVVIPTCTPPPAGLAGWWPGEGGGEDSVAGHNGVMKGGVGFGPGKVGQAFTFNGTNGCVDLAGGFNYQTFTLSLWVKPGASQVQYADILDTFHQDNANWVIQQNSTIQNQYYFAVPRNGTANYTIFNLKSNQWQHLVVTRDASNHNRVYVNGALVAETQDTGPINYTGQSFRVGAHASNVRFWKGSLDELAVFNRALGTNEIAAIYAARGAGKCPLPPMVLNVTPPSWYVNEGATVAFSATAVGSPVLTYQWQHNGADVDGATGSTLTLSNIVHAQGGNYAVVVSNPGGTTTSSNVLLRVNRAPIASVGDTELLLVSPNGSNAVAVLDGSASSDPDGDLLSYAWFHTGASNAFATGTVAVETLPLGTNQLTLVVSDGMASGSRTFAVEVITTSQAVDRLTELVQSGSGNDQPLLASLRSALAAIDRSHPETAINQLEAFKNKVLAQIAPTDPELANQLLADAQVIIDALNGGTTAPAVALEITALTPGNNGKPHLQIKGLAGRVHIVECSADTVNWVKVGIARGAGGSQYEFDDAQAVSAGPRFYRIVSPK